MFYWLSALSRSQSQAAVVNKGFTYAVQLAGPLSTAVRHHAVPAVWSEIRQNSAAGNSGEVGVGLTGGQSVVSVALLYPA